MSSVDYPGRFLSPPHEEESWLVLWIILKLALSVNHLILRVSIRSPSEGEECSIFSVVIKAEKSQCNKKDSYALIDKQVIEAAFSISRGMNQEACKPFLGIVIVIIA